MKRSHSQANKDSQSESQKKSKLDKLSSSSTSSNLDPSRSQFQFQSKLPPQLDLNQEIQSRSQQIKSLQSSIKAARSNATTRAWQLLPRAQRRRAASHNLLRLPKRLRRKGLNEMKSSATEPLTKSQIRKRSSNHPLSLSKLRRLELIKRASKKDRKWLETHLWHSKRFRMTGLKGKKGFRLGRNDRWGFVLAEEPNMKSQRATLRDALKKSTLHDSSYETFFRLSIQVPQIRKPKEYQRKNKKGEKRTVESVQDSEDLFSPEAIQERKIRDEEEATEALGSVLRFAGLANGWENDFNDGFRECQTTLLGQIDSVSIGASKNQDLDSKLGFCQALAPIRVLWVASSVNKSSGSTVASTSKLPEQAVKVTGTEMQVDETPVVASTSTSKKPTLKVGIPVKDQPSIQSQRKETFKKSQNNRNLKRKTHRAIASHPIPVRPTRELILRIHPGGIPNLRKNLINSINHQKGIGALPTQTQPFSSLTVKIPRIPNPPKQGYDLEKEEETKHLILHIAELPNAPEPEIAACSSRRRPMSVQKDQDKRQSKVEKRKEMGVIENFKGKKGKILKGSKRFQEIKAEEKDREEQDELLREKRSKGWNAYELLGPDSGRVLGGVLKLTNSNDGVKKEAFRALTQDLTPSEVPSGMVLSLDVHDPRVSFPPTNTKSQRSKTDSKAQSKVKTFQNKLKRDLSNNSSLAKGKLLTEGKNLPRFTKGDIHSRKAKLLIPGTPLTPTSEDDVIPIVLIQRNLTYSSTSSSSASSSSDIIDSPLSGWTFLVPRGWGSAFWLSLVHTGSRVLGQDQIRQLAFEGNSMLYSSSSTNGTSTISDSASSTGKNVIKKLPIKSSMSLAFPSAWVGTSSFKSEEKLTSKISKMEWGRRPKGKRVEFEKVGVKFPWGGDEMWKEVLGEGRKLSNSFKSDQASANIRPWLFHVDSSNSSDIKELAFTTSESDLGDLVSKRFFKLIKAQSASESQLGKEKEEELSYDQLKVISGVFDSALVMVSIIACRRGALHEGAGIHLLKDQADEVAWRDCLKKIHQEEQSLKSDLNSKEGFESDSDQADDSDDDEVRMKVDRNQDSKEMEELKALFGSSASSKKSDKDPDSSKPSNENKTGIEKYLGKDDRYNKELHDLESSPVDGSQVQIGSVPLGGFSLSIGRGFALGAMSLRAYLEILRRGRNLSESQAIEGQGKGEGREQEQASNLVLVRERNGGVWRAARVELVLL